MTNAKEYCCQLVDFPGTYFYGHISKALSSDEVNSVSLELTFCVY